MEQENRQNIKDKVMAAIESGRIVMRPRWHFVVQVTAVATGSVILFLTLLYLVAFILFGLRESGALFGPLFGLRGWIALLVSLPWLLVLLAGVFIVLLEFLVRRYAFAYRKPLLYSLLAIVALALVGGHFASRNILEERWLRAARRGEPPFPGRIYGRRGLPPQSEIHRGRIIGATPEGFVLEDVLGATSTVILDPHTPRRFAIGEAVLVLGTEAKDAEGFIHAFAIQPLPALP